MAFNTAFASCFLTVADHAGPAMQQVKRRRVELEMSDKASSAEDVSTAGIGQPSEPEVPHRKEDPEEAALQAGPIQVQFDDVAPGAAQQGDCLSIQLVNPVQMLNEQLNYINSVASAWLAKGSGYYLLTAAQWAKTPRESLVCLLPGSTVHTILCLFLASLSKTASPEVLLHMWNKYKRNSLLALVDPAYKEELSWKALFSQGKGKGRKQAHLDSIFLGVIQMPWHPQAVEAARSEEPQGEVAPGKLEGHLELEDLWHVSLANMGLVPYPPFADIVEALNRQSRVLAESSIAFAIGYARTSSEGKASERSTSFQRQLDSFSKVVAVSPVNGVCMVPLCVAYNPKGEASHLPMMNQHRPYASRVWQLLHEPAPLLRIVMKCLQPCISRCLKGSSLQYCIVESISRFSRDIAYGIEDFRSLVCQAGARLYSVKEPHVFQYVAEPVHMRCGVLEWWPPHTMIGLSSLLLQAHLERALIADRTRRGREDIVRRTTSLLTPYGKNGSGQRSLCHVFQFHKEFALKLMNCSSPWGDAMKQLVDVVNAWTSTLPAEVLAYLGPKAKVSLKALATIKQKVYTVWLQDGSPDDLDAWLESHLTPELAQRSHELVSRVAMSRHRHRLHRRP